MSESPHFVVKSKAQTFVIDCIEGIKMRFAKNENL